MKELHEMKCEPVKAGTPPLEGEQIVELCNKLPLGWKVYHNRRLSRTFEFENYKRAMAFTQEIALLAEKEQHHPDVCVHPSNVVVEITTLDIGGLSMNDFILASKIEHI